MFQIFGINTEKISLVTKDHTPAVPKATTGFAMFKFMMPKTQSNTIERIEKIQKKLAGE